MISGGVLYIAEILTGSRETDVLDAFRSTLHEEACSVVTILPDDDTGTTKLGNKFEAPQNSQFQGILCMLRLASFCFLWD